MFSVVFCSTTEDSLRDNFTSSTTSVNLDLQSLEVHIVEALALETRLGPIMTKRAIFSLHSQEESRVEHGHGNTNTVCIIILHSLATSHCVWRLNTSLDFLFSLLPFYSSLFLNFMSFQYRIYMHASIFYFNIAALSIVSQFSYHWFPNKGNLHNVRIYQL